MFHSLLLETMYNTPPRSNRRGSQSSRRSVSTTAAVNLMANLYGALPKTSSAEVINGVRTVNVNTVASDNIYHGKYTYKPNKQIQGGKYDRTNCSHGTFHDKDYIRIQSNIAQTGLFVTCQQSNVGKLIRFSQQFLKRRNVDLISSNQAVQGMSKDNQDRRNVAVIWQKCELTIANRNKHACRVELFDLIAKQDINNTGTISTSTGVLPANNPIGLMQEDLGQSGTKNSENLATSGYTSIATVQDLDFHPERCPTLRAVWGIANKTYIDLSPGDSYTHTTFHRKNTVVDFEKWINRFDSVSNSTTIGMRGVTTCVLVRATGRVVHVSSGAGLEDPTFDGVHLDTIAKYTTYCREYKPFQDYFQFDSTNQWSREGEARTFVSAMEEDNPTDTVGV